MRRSTPQAPSLSMANGVTDPDQTTRRTALSALAELPGHILAHVARFWPFWLAFMLIAAAAWVGLETGLDRLFQRWVFPYNHSPLVVGMAAWLLFVGLRGVTLRQVSPSVAGLLLLATVVAVYALSEIIDLTLGMQVMLPLVVWASVYALMGRQLALYLTIPVGMLYFTIPIWDLTVGPLQDISTLVVSAWVRWSGLTALIEGYYITIPAGRFEIAEGCSGMRYVVVSLALAAFYAMNWLGRWRNRLMLVLVAGLASMVANWIRIYTLILIGHWTDMQHYLIAVSHDEYGWVVFFVCMAPVLWFARHLEARETEPKSGRPGVPVANQAASALQVLLCGVLAAAIVAAPVMLRGGEPASEPEELPTLISAPSDPWTEASVSYAWEPQFEQPSLLGHQAFTAEDGRTVEAYVARYLTQHPDAKLIARRNVLSPGWHGARQTDTSMVVGGEDRRVRRTELRSGDATRLTVNWFVVGGRSATGELQAKLLEIPALFSGRRDGAIIAVSAACSDNCSDADELIRSFLETHGEQLEAVADGR